jgi:hypothetical protein
MFSRQAWQTVWKHGKKHPNRKKYFEAKVRGILPLVISNPAYLIVNMGASLTTL